MKINSSIYKIDFLIKKGSFILFFIFLPLSAQKFDRDRVWKQLWNTSNQMLNNGEYKQLIKFNQKLIDECIKNDYDKVVAVGYYNIGNALSQMGNCKESLQYLDRAVLENKKLNNQELQSLIYAAYGDNYLQLEQYTAALKYYQKTISETKKTRKSRQSYLINFAIGNIAQIYELKHKNDSALYYRRQAFKIQDDPFNTLSLANFYLEYKKNSDSAKYYLDRATKKWGSDESIYLYEIYTINEYWGKFYEQAKDFERSEKYYSKALELAYKVNISSYIMDSYNHLYTINQKSNNVKKANFYLLKYTTIKDSIASQQKKSLDFSAQKFLNEKEKEYKNNRLRIYLIFGGLTLIIIIFLIIFIRNRYKKEKDLQEILKKKRETLKAKEEETLLLKDKVNESFDEIIKLAKDNDPQFPVKFRILYPEFCEALTKIYPDINNDTLKFCALIKLKFSTKNIAEYTFVTIRAVQIRKTRLRKKLNIPSDVDIYVWMDNLV